VINAWMLGAGLSELDSYTTKITAVGADDIQRLATDYFDTSRIVEGVVRGEAAAVTA
jgi:hypothetical protein